MAVKIRLSRFGRLHRPYFRIVAIDSRCHREGKANEILGSYDPLLKDKNIQVDMDRVQAWVAQGAQVSESLGNLLKFHGYQLPAKPAKSEKPSKKTKPKVAAKTTAKGQKAPWVAPSRRSLRQHAAKKKAERKLVTAAEVAAAQAKKAAEKPAEGAAPAAEPAKT